MTADMDAVLSRLRERPECRDAVEVIERLAAERDAFVRAKESQVGRLEARAQEAEAENERLRDALFDEYRGTGGTVDEASNAVEAIATGEERTDG